ncbi:hypothetical protein, partial [Bradyrhizobium sp. PRIMUS42]|uniref:hypothetical protein n=1 Tax=Bradyrhizobium sp. PRIMUS42 TaxID=2908926 RepID=UPI001FF45B21
MLGLNAVRRGFLATCSLFVLDAGFDGKSYAQAQLPPVTVEAPAQARRAQAARAGAASSVRR